MQHLNNICLKFHCKILKIERVTVNLRRRLEKKLFCGVDHNSHQNHLKQKNQSAFVKGDVSRGNSGRIFCSTNSQLVNLYRNPAWSNERSNTHNFVNFIPVDMKFLQNILEILCNHLKEI